jgi:uncharacterized protein
MRVGPGLAPSPVADRDAASRVSTEMTIRFQESDAGITFAIKIHPRAKRNAITGELGGALKLSLIAPPVDGKANEACIEFFAKLLKLPGSSITIAAGQTSRNKVIRVAGLSAAEVRERLAY